MSQSRRDTTWLVARQRSRLAGGVLGGEDAPTASHPDQDHHLYLDVEPADPFLKLKLDLNLQFSVLSEQLAHLTFQFSLQCSYLFLAADLDEPSHNSSQGWMGCRHSRTHRSAETGRHWAWPMRLPEWKTQQAEWGGQE